MADCEEIEAGQAKKKGRWNFWRLSQYELAGYEIFLFLNRKGKELER